MKLKELEFILPANQNVLIQTDEKNYIFEGKWYLSPVRLNSEVVEISSNSFEIVITLKSQK